MFAVALKMLLGDRAKYFGLLFDVTFTSFLVSFAASYFGGMMTRSFTLISESPADVWVRDPGVWPFPSARRVGDAPRSRTRVESPTRPFAETRPPRRSLAPPFVRRPCRSFKNQIPRTVASRLGTSPTLSIWTDLSMRRRKPESAVPGPSSMNRVKPRAIK